MNTILFLHKIHNTFPVFIISFFSFIPSELHFEIRMINALIREYCKMRLLVEIMIIITNLHEFECHKLVSLGLKPPNDISNQSSVHPVRFDHQERPLHGGRPLLLGLPGGTRAAVRTQPGQHAAVLRTTGQGLTTTSI